MRSPKQKNIIQALINYKITQNTRLIGLSTKLILPTFITISILGATLCYTAYNNQKKNLIDEAKITSRVITHVGSQTINGDYLASIRTEDDTVAATYNQIINQLNKIRTDKSIKYIYTLYFKDKQLYYGVDACEDKEIKNMPGDKYKSDNETNIEYETLMKGKAYLYDQLYIINKEKLITSLAPIYDSNNNVVGALGCGYNAEPIFQKLNSELKKLVLITILGVLFSTILITFIIGSVIKNIKNG